MFGSWFWVDQMWAVELLHITLQKSSLDSDNSITTIYLFLILFTIMQYSIQKWRVEG